jgi:hypothetical protein
MKVLCSVLIRGQILDTEVLSGFCLSCRRIQVIPAGLLSQCQILIRDLVQTSLVLTSFSSFGYPQLAMCILVF